MSLDDIVSVSITAESSAPTRPGFGTPLLCCYHTGHGVARTLEYASLAEMVDDGWATTEIGYKLASRTFAQSPRVKKVKIGRRALPPTQVVKLTVTDVTVGRVLSVTLGSTTYSYTVVTSDTTTIAAAALAALIDANASVVATSSVAVITSTTGTAGVLVEYKDWSRGLEFQDTSTDPGIATDLAAILLEDSDWYGLALDTVSETDNDAAAAWAESNGKLFAATTCDVGCTKSATTTDVMSDFAAAAYARSGAFYNGNSTHGFTGAAILGDRFPYNPGSDTWAYKTLAGVTVDRLTGSQRSAILAKHGNCYNLVAGLNVTEGGKTGSGEYFDTTRFIDWLQAEIQINVFALIANNQKIPYTNAGVDMVKAVIDAALKLGILRGGLVEGTTEVLAPDVGDISPTDKANRFLPDITFTGTLAGAIHSLDIQGTLSV